MSPRVKKGVQALVVVALSLPALLLANEFRRQTVPYGRGIYVRYGYFSRVAPDILVESKHFLAEFAGTAVEQPNRTGKTRRWSGEYALNHHFQYGEKGREISTVVCSRPLRTICFRSDTALQKAQLETQPQFRPETRPSPEEAFAAARPILAYLGVPDNPDLYRILTQQADLPYKECSTDGVNCAWVIQYVDAETPESGYYALAKLDISLSLYSLELVYLQCDEEFLRQYH